jgi:PTH1 family peptidyl-tRNA hydrolase
VTAILTLTEEPLPSGWTLGLETRHIPLNDHAPLTHAQMGQGADYIAGALAEGTVGGERVLALKPMTFMNLSGDSVAACARFYKIDPGEIAVIHDELDLAPGKLRVKRGGGSAGHNGLRSIDAAIGTDYWRVRLGIGHPGVKELVHPYVLQDFGPEEMSWVTPLVEAVAEALPLLVADDESAFMSKVALILNPPPPKPTRPQRKSDDESNGI